MSALHHDAGEGPPFPVGQAAAAEDGGDLGAGVVVQQLVDLGDGAGFGLPDLPGRLGYWQGEGAVLAAGQADVRGDGVAGPGHGDVGEQSRAMRRRSRIGVAGSFQMPGRSVTSWAIRSFWASVSCPVCCSPAWS